MINIKEYISSIDRSLLYKLGVICLVYIVFIFFFLVPAFKDYGVLTQKKKENKDLTQKALKSAQDYAAMSQKLMNAEILLEDVSKLIATDKQVKNALSEISELATECNVKILEITPEDRSLGQDALLDKYCDRQGLQIDLESGYHQLAKFIQKLETHNYIFQIISLRMIPGESADKKQLARLELAAISKKRDLL
ncbi:MAG: type 4a pilus biogenesis protein PilO [Candidatus Omnitrophica bacterium]|nr:type 4a pilus biogenesis protein PilO [Candidatus Omnitrophota bacterium]